MNHEREKYDVVHQILTAKKFKKINTTRYHVVTCERILY